jgi:epoxyqueuosine reductase
MNKNKWEVQEEYPKLKELTDHIKLEKLSEIGEKTWLHNIYPKFWYINQDRAWVWRTNAIRAMVNNFDVSYSKYLEKACQDEHGKVREMAIWACKNVGLTIKYD